MWRIGIPSLLLLLLVGACTGETANPRLHEYSIELLDVYASGENLVIKAMMVEPLSSGMQAQVITHPYLLVYVPKGEYRRVELRDTKGETLAVKTP